MNNSKDINIIESEIKKNDVNIDKNLGEKNFLINESDIIFLSSKTFLHAIRI